jgi:carbonic anhydrase/acetyltransferase-like protein (isoleucine patch superfamily)
MQRKLWRHNEGHAVMSPMVGDVTPEALKVLLQQVRLTREAELAEKFDRSLPFADGLFDRWERAKRLGFGAEASIYDSACVFGKVLVGAKTWIGPYVLLDGSGGGITIGATCSISAGVHIYTHDTVMWALSGGKMAQRLGPVAIGNRVYVGSQAVITRGVTIGDMTVVAANSFVRENVPLRTIVGGVPAVPIGRVEGDDDNVQLIFDQSYGDCDGNDQKPRLTAG